jgi:hypothetical protein
MRGRLRARILPPKEKEDARQAGEVGAAAPPTDVDTTGSSPEHDPQAATTAPDDWRQNPYVQIEGGFLAGVSLGLVPLGGVGQQLADAGEVLPNSYEPDHRRAHSKGGPSNQLNLTPSCRSCNRSKGAKDLESEWAAPNDRK